jgi:hypothetical protein
MNDARIQPSNPARTPPEAKAPGGREAARIARPASAAAGFGDAAARAAQAAAHFERDAAAFAAAWGGWPPPTPSAAEAAKIARAFARLTGRWRWFWHLRCILTDHVNMDPPGASEPFCERCGRSTYWPARRTLGRYFEDLLAWCRQVLSRDEVPF